MSSADPSGIPLARFCRFWAAATSLLVSAPGASPPNVAATTCAAAALETLMARSRPSVLTPLKTTDDAVGRSGVSLGSPTMRMRDGRPPVGQSPTDGMMSRALSAAALIALRTAPGSASEYTSRGATGSRPAASSNHSSPGRPSAVPSALSESCERHSRNLDARGRVVPVAASALEPNINSSTSVCSRAGAVGGTPSALSSAPAPPRREPGARSGSRQWFPAVPLGTASKYCGCSRPKWPGSTAARS